ncbi:Retrovirus-related Pol polyprotein from transposon opus, partial [Mucuna pruriens]
MVMVKKSSGATYQQLMDRIFKDLIGQDLEVYVDHMVVKSTTAGQHYEALARAVKFLGFILSRRGIEANPEKCKVIINMRSPKSVKKVQQLAGRITTLARFLSRSAEITLLIFHYL